MRIAGGVAACNAEGSWVPSLTSSTKGSQAAKDVKDLSRLSPISNGFILIC